MHRPTFRIAALTVASTILAACASSTGSNSSSQLPAGQGSSASTAAACSPSMLKTYKPQTLTVVHRQQAR
jgi:hypothetical protein